MNNSVRRELRRLIRLFADGRWHGRDEIFGTDPARRAAIHEAWHLLAAEQNIQADTAHLRARISEPVRRIDRSIRAEWKAWIRWLRTKKVNVKK